MESELGFTPDVESVVVSGAVEASGLGVAEGEGLAVAPLLSLLDVVDCLAGADWPRARGERRKITAAASMRGFIVLDSGLGLSQNPEHESH